MVQYLRHCQSYNSSIKSPQDKHTYTLQVTNALVNSDSLKNRIN